MTPRANTNEPTSGWPVAARTTNSSAPIASAAADTRRAITATCRCSGVFTAVVPVVSWKIRPNWVAVPVA